MLDTIILNVMKIVNFISEIFGVEVCNISLKESIKEVEISFKLPHIISCGNIPSSDLILDHYLIDFLYCGSSELTFDKNDGIETFGSFIDNINAKIEEKVESLDLNDPDYLQIMSSLSILIKIRKEIRDRVLNIYNFISFCEYWNILTWENRLSVLSQPELKNGLVFFLLEKDVCPFKTEAFFFSHDLNDKPRIVDCLDDIRENVYWGNLDLYQLTPLYFHIIERSSTRNIVEDTFDVLSTIFSLCSIFDIVSLNAKEEKLVYKLCGYKNINSELNITQNFNDLKNVENEYFKLFKWIYISDGNRTDKVGIVRNVLSLFITDENIIIQENVFLSVQSSFKTYLKENLDKYVAIRNQIYQELDAIIALSASIKKEFLQGFKHNLFACVTFFFSTIVLEVLGNNSQSSFLFSKDICILCYAVFFISFLYLFWIRSDVNIDKMNIINRYDILKKRYSDLLIPEEIDIILRNGEELKEQVEYIDFIKKKYSRLWFFSLLILSTVVTMLSPAGQIFIKIIVDFKSIVTLLYFQSCSF